jgi:O-antigen/teichoic acid export membrane protein
VTNNSFFKNIVTLTSGNSFAQLIPILIAPILTRIYTVEDFATFALFISVCSVLGVFSNLKYAGAIVIADLKKEVL